MVLCGHFINIAWWFSTSDKISQQLTSHELKPQNSSTGKSSFSLNLLIKLLIHFPWLNSIICYAQLITRSGQISMVFSWDRVGRFDQLIVAWWRHMVTKILVNIGSGNGLLPDDTKPLPEPMLTYHKYGPVTFIWGQLHQRCPSHQSQKSDSICLNKISFKFKSPKGQWVKVRAMMSNHIS